MTDIVAELRRMYAAVAPGEWTLEPYAGFTSGAMGYDIRIGPNAGDVIVGADRALLDYGEREIGNLIVAMHNHLPALLRMVESLRLYVRHMEQDNPDDPDQWIYLMGRRWEAIVAALAKLEQDGER